MAVLQLSPAQAALCSPCCSHIHFISQSLAWLASGNPTPYMKSPFVVAPVWTVSPESKLCFRFPSWCANRTLQSFWLWWGGEGFLQGKGFQFVLVLYDLLVCFATCLALIFLASLVLSSCQSRDPIGPHHCSKDNSITGCTLTAGWLLSFSLAWGSSCFLHSKPLPCLGFMGGDFPLLKLNKYGTCLVYL